MYDVPCCGDFGDVASVQAANLTEEDIDQIIQKGERATEELNNKMTEFTENAMKFTLDGGFTPYEFRDADDEAPHDPDALRAIMGALFLMPH